MADNGSVVVALKDEQQQQQAPVSPAATVITHHHQHHDSTIATPITSSGVISATASASSTPTPSIPGGGDGQAGSEVHEDDAGFGGWFYENGSKNGGGQIQLETPAVEENPPGSGLNVATAAKPKRLSDEFYSADDDYEEEEDEDDEMMGGGLVGVSSDGGSASGSSSTGEPGLEKTATDCEAHADLNEIKNLSITNGSGGVEARDDEDRFADRNENSISDPIYIGEETSSCSRGEEESSGASGTAAAAAAAVADMEHDAVLLEDVVDDDEDVDEDELQDVQSRDAIERRDFEQEQKLTGGIIIKNSAFIPTTDRLNLDLLSRIKRMRDDVLAAKKPAKSQPLASTPTSSRQPYKSGNPASSSSTTSSREQQNSNSSTTKSTVKVNLSASLEDATVAAVDGPSCSSSSSSSSASGSGSGKTARRQQQIEAFLNSNSNDSLSSDRSIFIPNLQALKASVKDAATAPNSSTTAVNEPSSSSSSPSPSSSASSAGTSSTAGGTTTKPPSDCSLSSCATSVIKQTGECSKNINHHAIPSTSTSNSSLFSFSCPFGSADRETGEGCSSSNLGRFPSSSSNFTDTIADEVVEPASSSHRNTTSSSSNANPDHVEDPLLEPSQLSMPPELVATAVDHECDEDNWADCEEGSDEEVCTCRDYTDDEGDDLRGGDHPSSEDELPSRDVDLSSYTHMDAAEDILAHDPSATGSTAGTAGTNAKHQDAQTPRLHRKRKLTENRINLFGSGGGGGGAGSSSRCSTGSMVEGNGAGGTGGSLGTLSDSPSTESLNFSSRKRLALDSTSSPRASLLSPSNLMSTPTSSSLGERKTPRSIIPTKDNPPPELNDWLMQFQRWTPVERLVAVDLLIEHCEPTQVRHMMKVIEPQFQRDFISLLPKELALQVLSFLEPKDLLRAAQTCRSWRFLADDNLLWKEKCKVAGILMEALGGDRPKRGRAGNMPPISSPWKAAYMRQHIIEMNWRSRPIRTAKVLKGHDDHVITCLQFCGNRIVSGSDDNTLKVWSAITGKCLRTLVGHTGGVWSSQMSGNVIISGSTDRTLKVWNADTGQLLHTLYGHTSTVRCMHLHGNKVVSGSRDATLRVWDVNEGTCLHVLVGHLAAVRCVQYDGRLVVSGAYDYMVKVWNPERQECLHTLQGHTNRVYSLQFDGIHVVSGSLDTSIRVWDAETGSCKHALMGHQSLTSGMELRQNILVSGNADSTVKVWDIITGQCLQTLSGPNKHQSAVTCLQFNSRFVITSSDDGTVKLWDVKTGEFIRNLVALESGGSGGVVWRIRANDTKLICAVGSRNGTEETKLMVLDFDVEGACLKCS
uniref:F-box/WD repeat-containing protein 7 n=1 Tax=Culex tarsalis TaxID=7177 RepID=A0A1Q3G0W2_CULTA